MIDLTKLIKKVESQCHETNGKVTVFFSQEKQLVSLRGVSMAVALEIKRCATTALILPSRTEMREYRNKSRVRTDINPQGFPCY